LITELVLALAFVMLAVLAFVGSVRLGMLLGRRMDRAIEARVRSGGDEEAEESRPGSPSESAKAQQNSTSVVIHGREEYRGE
jgi:hypothetical protein